MTEVYNYNEVVKADIKEFVQDWDIEELAEECGGDVEEMANTLVDIMFTADSVTGNGSGSYFFNTWKAEEALCHNFDLLAEALADCGATIADYAEKYGNPAEALDVVVRCYCLMYNFDTVVEAIEEELV